jgi:peptidylprolyl isomerase
LKTVARPALPAAAQRAAAARARRLRGVSLLRLALLVVLLAVLGGASACGGDEGEESGGKPRATLGPGDIDDVKVANATDLAVKPDITVPDALPPGRLERNDLVTGDGRRARKDDTVRVQYVGVAWSSGQQFDASWDRNEPFTVKLGEGNVIPGWDKGVPGMRVGGRRLLVIPPEDGYGSQGTQGIAPNETLVFVIDLTAVR